MLEIAEQTNLRTQLKCYIVEQSGRQRSAKIARRTVHTPSEQRIKLLRELGLRDDPSAIQSHIDRQRFWLTVAHVIYGDQRGRPHPVSNPESYRTHAQNFIEFYLRS